MPGMRLSLDRFINSPATAVFAASMTPFFFHMHRNLFAYSTTQTTVSLATQTAIASVMSLFIVWAGNKVRRVPDRIRHGIPQGLPDRPTGGFLPWLNRLHWTDAGALAVMLLWIQPEHLAHIFTGLTHLSETV